MCNNYFIYIFNLDWNIIKYKEVIYSKVILLLKSINC